MLWPCVLMYCKRRIGTILSFEPFYKKRIINEMTHIEADKNSINHRTDIANLSLIYKSIIR